MKYLTLSCLLVCSLFSAMANTSKSTLSMLLKQVEEVYQIKISYSPTQTNRIIPCNQTIDSRRNLNETLIILLNQTGLTLKNQSGFYYLIKENIPAPSVVTAKRVEESVITRDTVLPYLSAQKSTIHQNSIISGSPALINAPFSLSRTPAPDYVSKWSLKTNLPLLLTGSLNGGINYTFNRQWSIGAEVSYNPWSYGSMRIRHFLFRPEARYWLCQINNGHYFYGGLQYMRYNIGGFPKTGLFSANIQKNRYQGNNGGVNLGYGYSWIIGKRFNLELELGLGVLYDSYTKYPCTRCGTALSRRKHIYAGPTEFAVNLVYILK